MKVKDFLTKDNWTKIAMARGANGLSIDPCSPDAVKWCMMGAIKKLYPADQRDSVLFRLTQFSIKRHDKMIATTNDDCSFESIKKLLDEADV